MTTISNNGGHLLTLVADNVNEMFSLAWPLLFKSCEIEPSRAGDVLVSPVPVMSIYLQPTQRVLFNQQRDANPFFHFFESLWMLDGRRDATYLDRFVGDFSKRFAEDDGDMHGTYGWRWRFQWEVDQLDVAVARLRKNPHDRRVVIAMWDPNDDCLEPDLVNDDTGDVYLEPKDLPCNTHIYLRVHEADPTPVLHMTVMCRSNDVVWGAYGANAVHFSFLHEYLAGRIGVRVGKLYQFSHNWHAYRDVVEKYDMTSGFSNPYAMNVVSAVPIGDRWEHWDGDLRRFMEWTYTSDARDGVEAPARDSFANKWFPDVAVPMFFAHGCVKGVSAEDALDVVDSIQAPDWRVAAREWIQRRIDRRAK